MDKGKAGLLPLLTAYISIYKLKSERGEVFLPLSYKNLLDSAIRLSRETLESYEKEARPAVLAVYNLENANVPVFQVVETLASLLGHVFRCPIADMPINDVERMAINLAFRAYGLDETNTEVETPRQAARNTNPLVASEAEAQRFVASLAHAQSLDAIMHAVQETDVGISITEYGEFIEYRRFVFSDSSRTHRNHISLFYVIVYALRTLFAKARNDEQLARRINLPREFLCDVSTKFRDLLQNERPNRARPSEQRVQEFRQLLLSVLQQNPNFLRSLFAMPLNNLLGQVEVSELVDTFSHSSYVEDVRYGDASDEGSDSDEPEFEPSNPGEPYELETHSERTLARLIQGFFGCLDYALVPRGQAQTQG